MPGHMLLTGSWNGKKLAIAVEVAVWEGFLDNRI